MMSALYWWIINNGGPEKFFAKEKTMSFLNEKAATKAGKKIARLLFAARGNNTEVHLKEDEVALIAKLAYEVGVQTTLKATQRIKG